MVIGSLQLSAMASAFRKIRTLAGDRPCDRGTGRPRTLPTGPPSAVYHDECSQGVKRKLVWNSDVGQIGKTMCRISRSSVGHFGQPSPVTETDRQHSVRHPRRVAGCARCAWTACSVTARNVYGSYRHDRSDGQVVWTQWLVVRPHHMGGDWGIGCRFCAQYMLLNRTRGRAEGSSRRGPKFADTKWARFEVRSPEQIAARGICQHAGTLQHRLATKSFFLPGDIASTVSVSSELEAAHALFIGGVPQVVDWLHAWRACKTPQSFKAAEENGITNNFAQGSRVHGTSRKAFASMVRVMSLCIRDAKIQKLRKATVVSLGLDDRGSYRLIRFTCDVAGSGDRARGCLGVLYKGGDMPSKELASCDDDYSRAMAQSVVRCIEVLATHPRTGRRVGLSVVIEHGRFLRGIDASLARGLPACPP